MREPVTAVVLVLLGATGAYEADGNDTEREHKMLAGLMSFNVSVNLDDMTRKLGPPPEVYLPKIELRLRQNGIPILTQRECASAAAPSCGFLVFTLGLTEGAHPSDVPVFEYAFNARLRAHAFGKFLHTKNGPFILPVFEREHFGTVGAQRMNSLKELVDDLLNQFMNEYLASQPGIPHLKYNGKQR